MTTYLQPSVDRTTIAAALPHVLLRVDLPDLGPRIEGKVRDIYVLGGRRVLVTTDQVSAFDRVLGAVPFKGQVLNQLSAWWFEQTRSTVRNHVLGARSQRYHCQRAFNLCRWKSSCGVTSPASLRPRCGRSTSRASSGPMAWTRRQLHKNDPSPEPVIAPTTKATGGAHDERLTSAEVVERGLVEPGLWAEIQRAALAIFRRGPEVARSAGLVLVDTKYEFGLIDGQPALIDEVHTPDSSRSWIAESYEAVRGTGAEPENFDKEFLRLWYVRQGYRGEGQPPALPPEVAIQMAERYIAIYERLTGETFVPGEQPAAARIERALAAYGG